MHAVHEALQSLLRGGYISERFHTHQNVASFSATRRNTQHTHYWRLFRVSASALITIWDFNNGQATATDEGLGTDKEERYTPRFTGAALVLISLFQFCFSKHALKFACVRFEIAYHKLKTVLIWGQGNDFLKASFLIRALSLRDGWHSLRRGATRNAWSNGLGRWTISSGGPHLQPTRPCAASTPTCSTSPAACLISS